MITKRVVVKKYKKVFDAAAFRPGSSDQVQKSRGATLHRLINSYHTAAVTVDIHPGIPDGGQTDRSVVMETCRSDMLACCVLF